MTGHAHLSQPELSQGHSSHVETTLSRFPGESSQSMMGHAHSSQSELSQGHSSHVEMTQQIPEDSSQSKMDHALSSQVEMIHAHSSQGAMSEIASSQIETTQSGLISKFEHPVSSAWRLLPLGEKAKVRVPAALARTVCGSAEGRDAEQPAGIVKVPFQANSTVTKSLPHGELAPVGGFVGDACTVIKSVGRAVSVWGGLCTYQRFGLAPVAVHWE